MLVWLLRPRGAPARAHKPYFTLDANGGASVLAQVAGRRGKDPGQQGPHPREPNCPSSFTQTELDDEGHTARDPGSSKRPVTFEGAEHSGAVLEAEAPHLSSDHAKTVLTWGDGSP